MLGANLLGINATGWLTEAQRAHREYLADAQARARVRAIDTQETGRDRRNAERAARRTRVTPACAPATVGISSC